MNLSSTHVIHGFKTACASVLAYAITVFFDLEFGYWAVISTVIVMEIYVADSVRMCIYRLSGTLIGAVLGTGVLLAIPANSLYIGAALFVTIGFCSFLTWFKPRYRMAAITATILIMTGTDADNALVFGTYRVLEIFIGILCAFMVSVLIFPKRKVDVLKEKLEAQARACSEKCLILVNAFTQRQQNVDERIVDELVKDVWDNHALLHEISRHERLIYRKKVNSNFSDKLSVMSRSVEHLRNMVRTLNALDENGYDIILSKELRDLASESGKVLVQIMTDQSSSAVKDLEGRVSALDSSFLNLREKGLTRRFDTERLVQVFSFYSSLVYFAQDILRAAQKTSA